MKEICTKAGYGGGDETSTKKWEFVEKRVVLHIIPFFKVATYLIHIGIYTNLKLYIENSTNHLLDWTKDVILLQNDVTKADLLKIESKMNSDYSLYFSSINNFF